MEKVMVETLYMTFLVVIGTMGMGYIIGKVNKMYHINMIRTLGYKKVSIDRIIGVPMHEFGHYIMCKIFGHKVLDVVWLNNDKSDNLGMVTRQAYSRHSPRQILGLYYIPQGPLWTGSISIYILMRVFLPEMMSNYKVMQEFIMGSNNFTISDKVIELVSYNIGQLIHMDNMTKVGFWIFIFISTSIALNSDMSGPDIKNSMKGIMYVAIITFIINLFGHFGNTVNWVMKYNMWVVSMLILILTMSVIALIISLIIRVVVKGVRN